MVGRAVAGYGAGLSVSYQANAPSECPSFRHYDNDSKSRQGGTFASVSTRALWGPFMLYALIEEGSELHCKIDALPALPAETVVV